MKKAVIGCCLLGVSSLTSAADNGWFGFSIATGVSVFMNIDSATINGVRKDTPAERAGIVVGDVVTDIEGCTVPGCGAFKARRLLTKSVGESVHMKLRHTDGREYAVELTAVPMPKDVSSEPKTAQR